MTTTTKSQSPSQRPPHPAGKAWATFRTGPGGARIVWPDGSVDAYPSYAVIRLERRPKRIEGRVFRVKDGYVAYEAPRLTS